MAKKRKKKIKYNWFFIIFVSVVLSFCVVVTLSEHFSFPFYVPSWDIITEKVKELVNFVINSVKIISKVLKK